jgi:dihydrofolate synthase/folylpolyglutamate synthase
VVRDALVDVDWPARLEWLRTGDVDVLIDGAHNPDGAAALAAFLAETINRPVPLVLGTMRDKATECIIDALAGTAAMVVATAAPTPRALPAERLAALVRDRLPDRPILHEADPMRAVSLAAAHGTPVVVAGSLYLAGFVRQALLRA